MPNAVVIFLLMVGMLLVIEGKECDTDGPQRCWMIDNGEVELLHLILKKDTPKKNIFNFDLI